jgi:hypothetical protein
MGKRVLIYAVIYGSIGVLIGVCLALYTKDVDSPPKNIVLKNGSATKANKSHSLDPEEVKSEVAEPSPIMEETN